MKREVIDCEKMLAKYVSNAGSYPKYRNSYNSVIKKGNSMLKMRKLFEQMLHKRRYTGTSLAVW